MGKVTQKAESVARLYRMVATIRRTEEALAALLAEGLIPGFIHLSIGQEAVAAGVMSVLTQADTITSTHRGHGHTIAKGMKLDAFFAELLARDSGACRGRGGSMHVADVANGMLGANELLRPACRSHWARAGAQDFGPRCGRRDVLRRRCDGRRATA